MRDQLYFDDYKARSICGAWWQLAPHHRAGFSWNELLSLRAKEICGIFSQVILPLFQPCARSTITLLTSSLLMHQALAQTPELAEFPTEAVPITQTLFAERVAGHTYRGITGTGANWIMSFAQGGRFVWLHGIGAEAGTWRISDNLFCGDTGAVNAGCNEFRITDDAVFYKRRANGQIVRMSILPPVDSAVARHYVGRWAYRYPDLYKDADLTIIDSSSGRYHINTSNLAIRIDVCWGFDWPAVILVMSPQELAVALLPNDVVRGCENIGFVARVIDDRTLEMNWGKPRRHLTR